jgi:hypothetical protein
MFRSEWQYQDYTGTVVLMLPWGGAVEGHLHWLVRRFQREKVMDMGQLQTQAEGRSRRSLFRDLAALGYLTSFTHAGRYYTLRTIPEFDAHGLWFYRAIGFSRAGTLKEAVAIEVDQADVGRTHAELRELLRVRVHNVLLELVRVGAIGREPFAGVHLYVSADGERAAQQLARRAERGAVAAAAPPATLELSVEILAQALRSAPEIPAAEVVASRLAARGVVVGLHAVERVFGFYGLEAGKKTAPPTSPPSRR